MLLSRFFNLRLQLLSNMLVISVSMLMLILSGCTKKEEVFVTPKYYTITFDANGGTAGEGKDYTQLVERTKSATKPVNNPTKENYIFSGWGESISSTIVNNFDNILATKRYYAQWKEIPVSSLTLNKSSTNLYIREKETLILSILPTNAANKNVTWSSSNTNIAIVSSTGEITGVSAGTATISVTTIDKTQTASCTVNVSAIAVSGISLNATNAIIGIGNTQTLTAIIAPTNASNQNITWSSNNTSIASVSSTGVVTGKALGTATITATTADGGKTATCNVTITTIPVSNISLNKLVLNIAMGSSETLTAIFTPSNATNKGITWSSNNASVATVSPTGSVTGQAIGTTTITATTADGGKIATCTVNVTPVLVSSISLNKSSTSIGVGGSQTLIATVLPVNATNRNIIWTSSNDNIASVSAAGVVTAKVAGTAIITATTAEGNKTATCTVTVTTTTVAVSSVSLNKTSTSISVGNTETLIATILPSDATNTNVSWSSSNPSVASVSSLGVVTGVTVGNAIITVTTLDGNKTATCNVSIIPIPVSSVSLNMSTTTISIGGSKTLIATVLPNNATNTNVSWSSSNPSVASVSSLGVVTGVTVGDAIITVTTSDGAKTATCNVTVNTSYDITFNNNDRPTNSTVETINTSNNTPLTLPTPTKLETNYVFNGWYTDPIRGTRVGGAGDSYTPSGTITLYGQWSVTLNSKTYKIVIIGTQIWLAENLNDAGHSVGSSVEAPTPSHGRLYTWDAAINIDANITGWHLPTTTEWDVMINYLGGNTVARDKLLSGGSSGFDAPKWVGFMSGSYIRYQDMFWSSTQEDNWDAHSYNMSSGTTTITWAKYGTKTDQYSIRLIKD